jgi:hypothetical protein
MFATDPVFSGADDWRIAQVVPTASGTYVVATRMRPAGMKSKFVPHPGLYLVQAGKLVWVRNLSSPGTFTAVPPLAAGG